MPMNERLGKAQRILLVQRALDRLAAWTLFDLERRDLLLQARRQALVRFLDGEAAFSGTFSVAMMRRLQGLAEAQAALKVETEAQAVRCREEHLRLRQAERIVDRLGSEARRVDELRELADLIEASLDQGSVRPGQA